MAAAPHNWILLTKRADRQREFSLRHTLPPNVWAGVSITSPQDQRLRYLVQTRARVRWVSYEPMLAPVDWRPWLSGNGRRGVDWIIVGGASGPDFQKQVMDLTWLADTVKQCRDANVPLFVKQDSGRNPGQQGRIPDDLWVRQLPRIIGAESRPKGFGVPSARGVP